MTNEHIKKIWLAPLALKMLILIFSNLFRPKVIIFHIKLDFLGRYLNVSYTLFILYFEGSDTLF